MFGERGGIKPWRKEWAALTQEVRKAELAKQREIEASNTSLKPYLTLTTQPRQRQLTQADAQTRRILQERADKRLDIYLPKTENDLRGHVYIITNRAFPGYVKIGKAVNPFVRARALQTGMPDNLGVYEVHWMAYHPQALALEAEVHRRLAKFRRGGEWFEIDKIDAEDVLIAAQLCFNRT